MNLPGNSNAGRLIRLVAGAIDPPPGAGRIALALAFGVVVHTIFAAAVLAMIVAMYFGMSRSLGAVPYPLALVVNAALVLQFPIVHSLLLTRRGGKLLSAAVPGRHGGTLATTSYAIVASVQLLALFALWTPSGIVWWQAEGAALYAITAAYAVSWLLLIKASYDAGAEVQSGALGWMSLMQNVRPKFPDMPTTGLFAVIRQPIYVAFALTLWTVPVWTPDQLALALTLTAYCLAAPRLKERRFAARYGARFEAYRARVPYAVPLPHGETSMAETTRNDLGIYDRYAAHWWSDEVRWVRTLKNLVPGRLAWFDRHVDWAGAEVLDLGCAGGFMAEALTVKGARVTGIDPSTGAIEAGRARAAKMGQEIRYDVGAGEALPYGDDRFDAVVCVDVLEHVEDLDRVLAEVARVLRPGGTFLYDTINRNPLSRLGAITIAEDLLGLLPKGTHDPALFIKPAELKRALEAAGLEPGPTTGLGPRGVNRRLDLTFGPMPLRSVIYMGLATRPARAA